MYVYGKVGVSQQYNIYLKTATFFKRKQKRNVSGLATALAVWYNQKKIKDKFRFLVFMHKIKEELLCKLFIFQANQCLFKVKKMKSIGSVTTNG